MAYYVIARDPKTHDEWVMPKTFDTILEAAEYSENCYREDPRFRYRLEGKGDETDDVEAFRAMGKLVANRVYGKAVGTNAAYLDTDSLRTKDFTVAELFPDGTYQHNLNYGAYMCTECSALVGDVEGHVKWHNKLLP